MTQAHEFLRQIRNDTFRASVTLRRNAFTQGRNLGDLHVNPSLCKLMTSVPSDGNALNPQTEGQLWSFQQLLGKVRMRVCGLGRQ